MSTIPSYIPVPAAAHRIPAPKATSDDRQIATAATARPLGSSLTSSPAQPAFPPNAASSSSSANGSSSRRFSIPAPSLSTNVSDLLLSSLLPANLPKLPSTSAKKAGPGRPRELNTQRETLRLDALSNNFRRFVNKIGPVFWLQDRIEEVLFWRKPLWTWAWLMAWTFFAFKPRLLLLFPSFTLILILLYSSEVRNPLPSLLGVRVTAPSASTLRTTRTGIDPDGGPVSTTTDPDGEVQPIAPPKEAESGVDYYMTLQALQNTMGWVADAYDEVYPHITSLLHPSKSPTSLPITPTILLLLLLPPSLLLPLIPDYLIPYLLLPMGWGPPLAFHPNLSDHISAIPQLAVFRRWQARATRAMLTDALSDELGRATISEVEVWENERLDPAVAGKPTAPGSVPPGSWGQRHLRAGERLPWLKIRNEECIWADEPETGLEQAANGETSKKDKGKIQELKDGWRWIPGEDWRVDMAGTWSAVGVDADGWVYSDDSWQNLAVLSLPLAELDSPVPALRRVTRRRKWWRRVYRSSEDI